MGQHVKTQSSCAKCSLEKVLQKVTDTIKLKDFMEVYSKYAVRAISDSSFLSPFSRLLSKWKQVYKAPNCALQQLPQKLLWFCVKAVKKPDLVFYKSTHENLLQTFKTQ